MVCSGKNNVFPLCKRGIEGDLDFGLWNTTVKLNPARKSILPPSFINQYRCGIGQIEAAAVG